MKQRNVRIELLRILAMLLIVMSHYIYHGIKFNPEHSAFNVSSVFGGAEWSMMELLYLISCVGVNCYIMITGYFMIERISIRWNGILKVWCQTLFYSIIFLITAICLHEPISKDDVLTSLLPVYMQEYWFVTAYVGLLVVAPFLSIIAKSITKRQYQIMLTMLGVYNFQFLYGTIYAGSNTVSWFAFVYLIAGYLKIYNIPKWWVNHRYTIFLSIWGLLYFMGAVINFVRGGIDQFQLVSSAYDGPMFFLSVSVFVLFASQKEEPYLPKQMTKISKIAQYTFGVYLIHENIFVSRHIWCTVIPFSFNGLMPFYCIATGLAIFLSALMLDYLRSKLFMIICVDSAISLVSRKLPQL